MRHFYLVLFSDGWQSAQIADTEEEARKGAIESWYCWTHEEPKIVEVKDLGLFDC